MTLSPPHIIKCPSCKKRQLRRVVLSGNTLGAKYYSDGKCVAPMLPDSPYIVKCPACGAYFKITDKEIGEEIGWEVSRENDSVFARMVHCLLKIIGWKRPFVKFLTVDEYIQATQKGLCNSGGQGSKEWEKDMRTLRILLWRAMNHDLDQGDKRAAYESNCRELLSLVKEDSNENRLMLAEIHRNLGEFDECMGLLKKVRRNKGYTPYILAIGAECRDKNTFTVEIGEKKLPDSLVRINLKNRNG